MKERPIGIFDSGIGGISIWKEINRLMPFEHTLYLADSKNAPYGGRSREEILALSQKNTELLLSQGCKIVVVACNTATTNAISALRKRYPIPFVGIEPAIKPAALKTSTGKIGVLATKGTLASDLFHYTSKKHAASVSLVVQEGKGLVEQVEKGALATNRTRNLLKGHLEPMLAKNIDCLVLGCTHYSFLVPLIREILPDDIEIIDSGEAVARQTRAVLEGLGLLGHAGLAYGQYHFYSNVVTTALDRVLEEVNLPYTTQLVDF